MKEGKEAGFGVLIPNLQIAFYYRLKEIRDLYLTDAFKRTIEEINIEKLDRELNTYVKPELLARVASYGLRGEVFFPVPYILESNPFLLGYYRLLYGLSQKEFYSKGPFGKFKSLEDRGDIPIRIAQYIRPLCESLIATGGALIGNIDYLAIDTVRDLQLLTLGPQFRGSENTRIGKEAVKEFFELIENLVSEYVKDTTKRSILIENDSGRKIIIEFSNDPDVRMIQLLPDRSQKILSIEIKGGKDASNVHNRLGEAEKSHLKAKNLGYPQFWTVLKIDVDLPRAKSESPTTTRFFNMDKIIDAGTEEGRDFRDLVGVLLGIKL